MPPCAPDAAVLARSRVALGWAWHTAGVSPRKPLSRRAAAARRRRRAAARAKWGVGIAVAAVVAPMLALGAFAVSQTLATEPGDHAAPVAAPVCDGVEARYSDAQLDNARAILKAGRDAGLTRRDRTIAVMTALGESSLRNIDYGDWETSGVTNPDGSPTTSIGLFQQQDGWGSVEERMDPYSAASLFYRAMVRRVPEPERSETAPTLVAHRTQINRDAGHYERYWPLAQEIVTALETGKGLAACG